MDQCLPDRRSWNISFVARFDKTTSTGSQFRNEAAGAVHAFATISPPGRISGIGMNLMRACLKLMAVMLLLSGEAFAASANISRGGREKLSQVLDTAKEHRQLRTVI